MNTLINLNINNLKLLDDVSYSYLYKDELINSFKIIINNCRSKGIKSLEKRKSKCQFCFPKFNAYSFHNPNNGDFIIKYVIGQKSKTEFIVQECKNNPIKGDNGMPF